MIEIEQVWLQIESSRRRANYYGHDFPMNAASTIDRIEQFLSRTTGFRTPSQLQKSLLLFDGMDRGRGVWRNSLIPLSVDDIVESWLNDRRREEEVRDEGDDIVKHAFHLPVMCDPTLHPEIFIDARDGSVLNYVVDGGYFEDFRFVDYLGFLLAVRDCGSMQGHMEWPSVKQTI